MGIFFLFHYNVFDIITSFISHIVCIYYSEYLCLFVWESQFPTICSWCTIHAMYYVLCIYCEAASIHLVRPHKSGYFTTMVRCLFPRRYTAEEAATIIVEDLSLDNNAETDIEDIETDDELVFDVLDRDQEEEPSSSRYDNDQEKESSLSEAETETSENQAERGEPGWIKTLKKRIREQESDKEFSSEPMVGNVMTQDQATWL